MHRKTLSVTTNKGLGRLCARRGLLSDEAVRYGDPVGTSAGLPYAYWVTGLHRPPSSASCRTCAAYLTSTFQKLKFTFKNLFPAGTCIFISGICGFLLDVPFPRVPGSYFLRALLEVSVRTGTRVANAVDSARPEGGGRERELSPLGRSPVAGSPACPHARPRSFKGEKDFDVHSRTSCYGHGNTFFLRKSDTFDHTSWSSQETRKTCTLLPFVIL